MLRPRREGSSWPTRTPARRRRSISSNPRRPRPTSTRPIIHVLKLPSILEHKKEFHQKFLAAEVADLASPRQACHVQDALRRAAAAGLLLQERDELDSRRLREARRLRGGLPLLLHRIKEEPSTGFIKYSPSNLAETGFSKRTDEHGFYYVKVIKLAEKHPLVEF